MIPRIIVAAFIAVLGTGFLIFMGKVICLGMKEFFKKEPPTVVAP